MKRLNYLISLTLAAMAQSVVAQNFNNPLTLLAPTQGNPWSGGYGNISSPFGLGALNPLNPLNSINPLSPWNSYGGMSNPVLSLGALGAINALTPSILPGSNPFAGNAYSGNAFASNPFTSNSYSRPQQPSFGSPAFSPSMPSYPNMPFAVQQPQSMGPGAFYPMQQQQVYPYMPYGAQQQQQQTALGNLFGLQAQPLQQQQHAPYPNFPGAQQPAQQPTGLPNLFGMMQQPLAQPAPQAKAQQTQQAFPFLPLQLPQAQTAQPIPAPAPEVSKTQPPAAQPPGTFPFFFFTPQTAPTEKSPAPEAKKPSETVPETKTNNAAPLAPLDPAAFMQMYMTPTK